MEINWILRFKNPVFLTTFLASLVGFIYTILGFFEIVPKIGEAEMTQIIAMIVSLLTTIGVLVDPTTSGVSDSKEVLSYDK